MASAQVDVWLAAHRGVLEDTSVAVYEMLADAALARMMLHRRRAVAAEVVGNLLAHTGFAYSLDVENPDPRALKSAVSELEVSSASGSVVASLYGPAPPLLFERALLAEMQGRYAEALTDLDALLKAYPGFVSAAIAAARMALMRQDPARAIRFLAYVESELIHIREGAALLADALHAIGMHGAASHYDLASLVCPGHAISHGNECVPVSISGYPASEARMPAPFTVGRLADGRVLCNDRGIYYVGRLAPDGSLTTLMVAQTSNAGKSGGSKGHSLPYVGLCSRLKMAAANVSTKGRQVLRNAARSEAGKQVYQIYRRLPVSIRYALNRYILARLRRPKVGWGRIHEQGWESNIARSRLRRGLSRILQFQTGPSFANFDAIEMYSEEDVSAFFSSQAYGRSFGDSIVAQVRHLTERGDLPPGAGEIFCELARSLLAPDAREDPDAADRHE
jgi:hypothetical protein